MASMQPAARTRVRRGTGNPRARHERARSRASEKLSRGPRVAIGLGLLVFTAVVLAHLTWAWSIASRLVPDTAGATPPPAIRVHWLGVAFTPTLTFTLL